MFRWTNIAGRRENPPVGVPLRQVPQLARPARWAGIAAIITAPALIAFPIWQVRWLGVCFFLCFSFTCAYLALTFLRDGYSQSNNGTWTRTGSPRAFWSDVSICAAISVALGAVAIALMFGLIQIGSGQQ